MAHVAVVGAGLGGVSVAFELREKLGKQSKVTVIGEGAEFNFVPSNPWVALGTRKRDDVVMPIGDFFSKRDIKFSPAGVKEIKAKENTLVLHDNSEIAYDYLAHCPEQVALALLMNTFCH